MARGPVAVRAVLIFACPRSRWRIRSPRPRELHTKKPDIENCVKAILDAASEVLFFDDRQVAHLVAEKWIGAQGEAPRVELTVEDLSA